MVVSSRLKNISLKCKIVFIVFVFFLDNARCCLHNCKVTVFMHVEC